MNGSWKYRSLNRSESIAFKGVRPRHRGSSALPARLAIAVGLALAAGPAWAQSVEATGSVFPILSPNPSPAWSPGISVVIGDLSDGSMTISDGGEVNSPLGSVGVSGQGTVVVTGPGSIWTSSNGLLVGELAAGELAVENGGRVVTAGSGSMTIGFGGSVPGTVTVTGKDSNVTVGGTLLVGGFGVGALTISDGATVDTSQAAISSQSTSEGSVIVTGAGSQLTSVSMNVGTSGTGELTIANGGTVSVSGSSILVGSSSGSGAINIGAEFGEAAQAPGILEAAQLGFNSGSVLNFNHTSNAYTLDSSLLGGGTINQLAGTTILSGDSSSFSGTTNVTGGTLYINGQLAGKVLVEGGTLGGSGNLGGLVVSNGGTLAPGNSIGTTTVGSVTFAPGSTFEVELNDGGFVAGTNNDLLSATGTVVINGGTVHVTPENGTDDGTTYTPGTYTIITAAGGVTGTFDALTDDYAFLDFTLSYAANDVFLISSLMATTFCVEGATRNQCEAGNGAFSLQSGNIFNAVLGLSGNEVAGALDALSGELHASTRTALVEDSRHVRHAVISRIDDAVGGRRRSSWAQVYGTRDDRDGDGNAAGLDHETRGLWSEETRCSTSQFSLVCLPVTASRTLTSMPAPRPGKQRATISAFMVVAL